MRPLRVHFLPELVAPKDLAGGTCLVIDVLRATTTCVYALAAGARAVIPCLTIEDARRCAARFPPGQAMLGGERGGRPIPGFELGNSPAEYTPASVGKKTVVLTTTNGTKALLHCRQASQIFVASFVNLSAVCTIVTQPDTRRLDIVCAGTDGAVTREDVLAAGALVRRLILRDSWRDNDQAMIALDAWSKFAERPQLLADDLRLSRGGRNLIEIGMQADIEAAAEIDRFAIAPRYNPGTGEITSDPRSK